jgi:hypothetical protein
MDEHSYWQVKYQEAINDCEASEVRFAMAFKPKIGRDGNQWSALVGPNPMEGIECFASTYYGVLSALAAELKRTPLPQDKN